MNNDMPVIKLHAGFTSQVNIAIKPMTRVYGSWNFSKKFHDLQCRWESNPHLWCDALPVELLSPWEQGSLVYE